MDFFTGTGYEVDVEKDLSIKKQFLDVVVVKKSSGQGLTDIPDGLDNLREHNLITFKSHQESLNPFAVAELIGHTVNDIKQASSDHKMIPEHQLNLYAVTAHFPSKLCSKYPCKPLSEGVYEIDLLYPIRIIVTKKVPPTPENAIWLMYSGISDKVLYGSENYHWKDRDISTVINQLFQKYGLKGFNMSYTKQDLIKDFVKEHLNELSPEDRLEGLSPDDVLKRFSPDDRLKGLSKKQLQDYLDKIKENEN